MVNGKRRPGSILSVSPGPGKKFGPFGHLGEAGVTRNPSQTALHELRLAAMKPLMLLMIVLLCAPSVVAQRNPSISPDALAQTVTIYRDRYGVPHVFGATDASTVFGFAYAQAEDNFWRVEENFISGLGRSAEVYGETRLADDRRNHAL